ncbi:glycosyltransferase [Thalassospira sp. MCCC 1A01428]|uniref:glycosyltransferase n=1 Tax=Thalassospira sp. MCCC 1A01428 TaxID=1470575 RepID=UPI000A1EE576|nr:glycosyltransferase [Thalassospira sp. MCCC 1A01428]OSQ44205.1 hypothetical protein THS27_08410 [Thalassospira sp. MCCC 1A01428]
MTETTGITCNNTITVVTTIHNGQGHWQGFFANLDAILGPGDAAIIVDDGSFPAVSLPVSLCDDARIRLFSPGKIGRGAALNLAISQAETRFIAIQDIDDRSAPSRLPIMKQLIARYPDQLIFCEATCLKEQGAAPAPHSPEPAHPLRPDDMPVRPIPAARLYRGNPFHHSCLVFPKTLWRTTGGYDASLPCCLDLDFYLRCLTQSQRPLLLLSRPLLQRNIGPHRHYSGLPARLYHETVLTLRAKYRHKVQPPFWTRLYDLRHFALAMLNRIKGWCNNA